jgi:hypothetical protein
MSWSVSAVGKPEAVALSIGAQFDAASVCGEPEETIRQQAREMIQTALCAQKSDSVVQVSANGSQSSTFIDGKWGAPYTNNLEIKVQPIHGFVE